MKINRKENDTRLNGKEKGEGRIGQDHRLPDSEGMAHTGAPKSDSEQHSIEEGREFDRETILRDEQADPEVRDIGGTVRNKEGQSTRNTTESVPTSAASKSPDVIGHGFEHKRPNNATSSAPNKSMYTHSTDELSHDRDGGQESGGSQHTVHSNERNVEANREHADSRPAHQEKYTREDSSLSNQMAASSSATAGQEIKHQHSMDKGLLDTPSGQRTESKNLLHDSDATLTPAGTTTAATHMTDHNHLLHRLNKLEDFQVAEGDPDIRGWKVKSKDGNTIGKVKDLIVDTEILKVRYIDLDLKKEFYKETEANDMHLLVPIGAARLHKEDDHVYIERISTVDDLGSYPTYRGDSIRKDYENAVVGYHTDVDSNLDTGTDPQSRNQRSNEPIIAYEEGHQGFYENDQFNEDRLYEYRRSH